MSLYETKVCPRKSFLHEVPSGVKKASQLAKLTVDICMNIDPKTPTATLRKTVHEAFEATTTMLPFEKEKEEARTLYLIERYFNWEKSHSGKVLARDENVKINFAGKEHSVHVHLLVERAGAIEAISFKNKAPQWSINSRKYPISQNPDLLLLQLAGEELLKGITPKKAEPVFGCFYFLKHANDKGNNLALTYDQPLGCNIYSYNFSVPDRRGIEKDYATVVPSAVQTCDKTECANCVFNDLCHLEFAKRKQMDMPEIEIPSINSFHLTNPQYDLVTFDDGVCRVNAVAGSGKTTVITLRTLRLLEEGANPEKILMMTFTEKAKAEMKNRLKAYAKGSTFGPEALGVDKIEVETFNSWGQKILDENYSKLGFSEKPQLIDDVVKKDILLELLDKYRNFPLDYRNPFMSTHTNEGCVMGMVKIVDMLKANHVASVSDVADIVNSGFGATMNELFEFYKEYNEQLIAKNLIDYEDQLLLILKLEKYGVFDTMEYEHMVIDEFQDSNPNQIDLVAKIMRHDPDMRSLVVVGDDMQAIYGFRNATPENLITFNTMFPEVRDINLEDNFRSTNPIIHIANNILEKESAIKKAIIAHKTETGFKPCVVNIKKDEDEIELFVKQAKKFIDVDHKPASSIAVLCRTKSELVKIQEAMAAEGIPTVMKVPEIMGDEPYVKAIIALALFFKDSNSQIDLALYAKSLGQDPFDKDLLQKSADILVNAMTSKATEPEKIQFFFDLCADAREDYVADNFLEELEGRNFRTLHDLVTYCAKYKKYETKEMFSTAKEDVDAVTLITIHSAKGLEWENVFLSLKRFRCDEEERRLFYVAVTRAKEKLLMTYTDKQLALIDLIREIDNKVA